jgi:hypothetical protein
MMDHLAGAATQIQVSHVRRKRAEAFDPARREVKLGRFEYRAEAFNPTNTPQFGSQAT